jgi:hypothetical protein
MWHVGRIIQEQFGPAPAFVHLMDRNLNEIQGRMYAIISKPSRLVNHDDLEGYTQQFHPIIALSGIPQKKRGRALGSPN